MGNLRKYNFETNEWEDCVAWIIYVSLVMSNTIAVSDEKSKKIVKYRFEDFVKFVKEFDYEKYPNYTFFILQDEEDASKSYLVARTGEDECGDGLLVAHNLLNEKFTSDNRNLLTYKNGKFDGNTAISEMEESGTENSEIISIIAQTVRSYETPGFYDGLARSYNKGLLDALRRYLYSNGIILNIPYKVG